MSRVAWRFLGLALGLVLGIGAPAAEAQGTQPLAEVSPSATVVYLVRHAEKVDDSADPDLSPAGRARAAELARFLGEAGVTAVFSSDFKRTRGTAEPLATALGLTIDIYDPRDPAATARTLRSRGGKILVVGHSNTVPGLVLALGGSPVSAIEDSEYDRLHIVILTELQVTTTLLRYGAPSP